MFGATALLVLLGTVIQQLVIGAVAGGPAAPAVRVVNVASYFSIESDALVGVTCLVLAVDPRRSSLVFRVFRFAGLVAIIVTSVVYHALFGDLVHFTGWGLVGDQILHTAVPRARRRRLAVVSGHGDWRPGGLPRCPSCTRWGGWCSPGSAARSPAGTRTPSSIRAGWATRPP